MLRETFLYLSNSRNMRRFVTEAPFAAGAARRFVAGEAIDDAIDAARALNDAGMTVSLDYLGESVGSKEEARAAADTYIRLLDRLAVERIRGNVSLKLTQMGQDIDAGFLRENVERVLHRAAHHEIFVRFDMESSDYTQDTLDFFRGMREAGHANCGVVIQSALYRSDDDVADLNAIGARVRLCKGAYREPASVAYQDKADVDAAYVRLMKVLLTDGVYPGIATHDEAMIEATKEFASEKGIDPSAFEFQMLYGVRRDLQRRLVDEGWNLRVYVPFGEAWYPYLMRRLAERPANLFFIVNNVVRESPLGFLTRR